MDLSNFKNALLYGGLEADEYHDFEPDIKDENCKNLAIYTVISTVMFGVLSVVSAVTTTFASVNAVSYGVCCLLSAGILLILKKAPRSVLARSGILDYFFSFILYGFALCITLLHPEYPAVTAIVVMPIIPLLFTKRPVYLALMTALAVLVFCALASMCKSPSIAATDIWNAVTFGIIGITVAVLIVCMRTRGFAQAKKILYLVSYDTLTNIKNRNCYEREIAELAASAQTSFGCVYADVNGLHELNNRHGHAEGDALLRCVASSVQSAFGQNTYRVGGDEFVALIVDEDEDDVRQRLGRMQARVRSEGYSSSCGYACIPAPVEPESNAIVQLVKDAEAEMFAQKAAHYSRRSNDRRSSAPRDAARM